MDTIRVLDKEYDIIELFEWHILVQDIDTGAVSVIEYNDLYQSKEDPSNVISLKGWSQWQKKTKTSKPKRRAL